MNVVLDNIEFYIEMAHKRLLSSQHGTHIDFKFKDLCDNQYHIKI